MTESWAQPRAGSGDWSTRGRRDGQRGMKSGARTGAGSEGRAVGRRVVLWTGPLVTTMYIYIYTRRLYSEHTLRCSGVCVEKKSKKPENLVSFRFYGSVSLIAQLQHSKQSFTTIAIPHLQHI
jgi:hypothetical protein